MYATIKNVKKIHIKIYEVNLGKHLVVSRNYVINEDSNLAFLKPTKEEIYEHKFINPYAVEDVCIKVNIEKKMGTFYVDLQG